MIKEKPITQIISQRESFCQNEGGSINAIFEFTHAFMAGSKIQSEIISLLEYNKHSSVSEFKKNITECFKGEIDRASIQLSNGKPVFSFEENEGINNHFTDINEHLYGRETNDHDLGDLVINHYLENNNNKRKYRNEKIGKNHYHTLLKEYQNHEKRYELIYQKYVQHIREEKGKIKQVNQKILDNCALRTEKLEPNNKILSVYRVETIIKYIEQKGSTKESFFENNELFYEIFGSIENDPQLFSFLIKRFMIFVQEKEYPFISNNYHYESVIVDKATNALALQNTDKLNYVTTILKKHNKDRLYVSTMIMYLLYTNQITTNKIQEICDPKRFAKYLKFIASHQPDNYGARKILEDTSTLQTILEYCNQDDAINVIEFALYRQNEIHAKLFMTQEKINLLVQYLGIEKTYKIIKKSFFTSPQYGLAFLGKCSTQEEIQTESLEQFREELVNKNDNTLLKVQMIPLGAKLITGCYEIKDIIAGYNNYYEVNEYLSYLDRINPEFINSRIYYLFGNENITKKFFILQAFDYLYVNQKIDSVQGYENNINKTKKLTPTVLKYINYNAYNKSENKNKEIVPYDNKDDEIIENEILSALKCKYSTVYPNLIDFYSACVKTLYDLNHGPKRDIEYKILEKIKNAFRFYLPKKSINKLNGINLLTPFAIPQKEQKTFTVQKFKECINNLEIFTNPNIVSSRFQDSQISKLLIGGDKSQKEKNKILVMGKIIDNGVDIYALGFDESILTDEELIAIVKEVKRTIPDNIKRRKFDTFDPNFLFLLGLAKSTETKTILLIYFITTYGAFNRSLIEPLFLIGENNGKNKNVITLEQIIPFFNDTKDITDALAFGGSLIAINIVELHTHLKTIPHEKLLAMYWGTFNIVRETHRFLKWEQSIMDNALPQLLYRKIIMNGWAINKQSMHMVSQHISQEKGPYSEKLKQYFHEKSGEIKEEFTLFNCQSLQEAGLHYESINSIHEIDNIDNISDYTIKIYCVYCQVPILYEIYKLFMDQYSSNNHTPGTDENTPGTDKNTIKKILDLMIGKLSGLKEHLLQQNKNKFADLVGNFQAAMIDEDIMQGEIILKDIVYNMIIEIEHNVDIMDSLIKAISVYYYKYNDNQQYLFFDQINIKNKELFFEALFDIDNDLVNKYHFHQGNRYVYDKEIIQEKLNTIVEIDSIPINKNEKNKYRINKLKTQIYTLLNEEKRIPNIDNLISMIGAEELPNHAKDKIKNVYYSGILDPLYIPSKQVIETVIVNNLYQLLNENNTLNSIVNKKFYNHENNNIIPHNLSTKEFISTLNEKFLGWNKKTYGSFINNLKSYIAESKNDQRYLGLTNLIIYHLYCPFSTLKDVNNYLIGLKNNASIYNDLKQSNINLDCRSNSSSNDFLEAFNTPVVIKNVIMHNLNFLSTSIDKINLNVNKLSQLCNISSKIPRVTNKNEINDCKQTIESICEQYIESLYQEKNTIDAKSKRAKDIMDSIEKIEEEKYHFDLNIKSTIEISQFDYANEFNDITIRTNLSNRALKIDHGKAAHACINYKSDNKGTGTIKGSQVLYKGDIGSQIIEIHTLDTTTQQEKLIGAIRIFLAKNQQGKTALIADSIDINRGFSKGRKELLTAPLLEKLTQLGGALGVDYVYLGKSGSEISLGDEYPLVNNKYTLDRRKKIGGFVADRYKENKSLLQQVSPYYEYKKSGMREIYKK